MKYPSPNELVKEFRDLNIESARIIRNLASAADEPDRLREIVDESCPATADYVQSMYSDPYDSAMWRRTVILHAIDKLLNTHGVESLPGNAIEYCNAGDTYAATLLYYRDKDELVIGCWCDAYEEIEREAIPEAWSSYGLDDFRSQLSDLLDSIDPEHDHDVDACASLECPRRIDSAADHFDGACFEPVDLGRLYRDGCTDFSVDEYHSESDGSYYFPTAEWCRAARAPRVGKSATVAKLVTLAHKTRVPAA